MKLKFLLLTFIFGIGSIFASVISDYEKRDLELVSCINNSSQGLISKIDYTQTKAGYNQLKTILQQPSTDEKTLIKRQKFIRLLLENPALKEKLKHELDVIHEHEQALINLFEQKDSIQEKLFSSLYFSNSLFTWLIPKGLIDSLNNSSFALTLRHYFPPDLISPIIEIFVFHFAIKYIKSWLQGSEHNHHHHHHHGNDTCGCNIHTEHDASFLVKFAANSIQALHFLIHFSQVTNGIQQTLNRRDLVCLMHQQMWHISKYLQSVQNIQSLIVNETDNALPFDLPNQKISNSLYELVKEKYTEKNPDLFAYVGETLIAHNNVLNASQTIADFNIFIGNIDAFLSTASLLTKTSLHNQHPYCFATYTPAQDTNLAAQAMWNPMLNPEQAITNDICFASAQDSKVIVTAPNKAGKSSIIKGIAINSILAQTLGIAAAQSFSISPFAKIITYINISDDITQAQSSFIAEMVRADTCLKILDKNTSQPILMIIDDSLFRSTNYEKGQQLALDFIKSLGKHYKAIVLVATHFPKLTELPDITNNIFANYHICIQENESGKKISTYKLVPGKNADHDAFDLIDDEHTLSFS